MIRLTLIRLKVIHELLRRFDYIIMLDVEGHVIFLWNIHCDEIHNVDIRLI